MNLPRYPRRLARLAAVQVLYTIAVNCTTWQEAQVEQGPYWQDCDMDGISLRAMDRIFFEAVVAGVSETYEGLDRQIHARLVSGWTLDRLDLVILQILRCGAWELSSCPDIPTKTILNEYVDIAQGFCDSANIAFINGLLERLARSLRSDLKVSGS